MTKNLTRRLTLISLASVVISSGVQAAKKEEKSEAGDPLSVELNTMAFPVANNGALVNYVFGVLRIQFSDSGAAFALREQPYLLRDSIVRIASRQPVPQGAGPKTFDRVAVTRIVLQAVQAVRPGARVVRVTLEDAVFMRN
jgi:hypothetical protein